MEKHTGLLRKSRINNEGDDSYPCPIKAVSMRAIVVSEPDRFATIELPKPPVGAFDALVKSDVAFICNATDRKLVQGTFPGISLDAYPLLLGHENVGTVVEVGEHVTSFAIGDRVIGGLLLDPTVDTVHSGWGGFCDYVLIRDHKAMVDRGITSEAYGWSRLADYEKSAKRFSVG